MKEVDRSRALEGIPKRVGCTVVVGLLAAYAVFAIRGDFDSGKQDFTFLAIVTLCTSIWYFRDLRKRPWFWTLMAALAGLHAAFIVLVPLPRLLVGGPADSDAGGIIIVWLFDSYFIYCCVRLAERAAQGWPKSIEVNCRVCGKDVDKRAVSCPHCGTWHPAPLSEWLVLIGLAPIFVLGIALWCLFGLRH